jgi:AraC-like DNA-binding protein
MQYVSWQRKDSSEEMTAEQTGLSRTQLSHLIDEWIFSERDRAILKRRLLDNICFEPLADEFDMSVRQIKRIVYKQGDKLLTHI